MRDGQPKDLRDS
jgi:hypothetical protein